MGNDHQSQTDIFLKRLEEIIRENLDNEQFGVDILSKEIGISRSHLHRKLKQLKGVSISQFIRQYRLSEAKKLLQNNVATTSEIAYRVGFNSPSYFHKCFQEFYGHAPSDIKKGKTDLEYPSAQGEEKRASVHFSEPPQKTLFKPKRLFTSIFLILICVFAGIYFFYPQQNQNSIAVLPIHNLTGIEEQEYFSKGFHDALIGALGRISGLRVISRTSTLRYDTPQMPLQKIAEDLGVDMLVEGSVSGSGDNIRIQLQLIDAFPEERHIWAEEYQQDLRNILEMQSDIVRNIAREIHISLTPKEESVLASSSEVNPQAFKACVKGMFHWDKLTEEDLNIALHYFNLALELDPDYAMAYSGIAMVWVGRLQQGMISFAEAAPQMREALTKANKLGSDNIPPEIHYMVGLANCWGEWRYQQAEMELRKAISLNPNFAEARAYLSHILNYLHQPEEAEAQIQLAVELDPFNPLLQALYGMHLNNTRQYDKAMNLLRKTLKSTPKDPIALSTLRTTYHMLEMFSEALEIWKTSYEVKEDFQAMEVLKQGEAKGGYQKALSDLAELLIARSDTSYVTPWQIGTLYTRAGEKMKAINWLEKAYYAHDANMPYIGVDPIFDILREEPRFHGLLKKMKLPLNEHPTATKKSMITYSKQ